MSKRCLTTTFMIMMNGLVLVLVCAEMEVPQKYGSTISTQIVLRHQKPNNYNPYSLSGNVKRKLMKNWQCPLKSLEPVLIALRNVIDRYEEKKSELRALFSGVAESGGTILPKRKRLKDFNCKKFENHKSIKKRIHKLLLKFHSDILTFNESFQELIIHERSPRFKAEDRSNGKRLKMLNELQTDLKMLDEEILDIVAMRKNKRLNFYRESRSPKLGWAPKSQTDLMILEWEIIQNSKRSLRDWMKRLHKKCWKCWNKLQFGQH